MPNFKRYYIPNAYIFITCATKDRIPYLESDENVKLFWKTSRRVHDIHPFNIFAYVILPDHFHWLMQVEHQSGNFSQVMHSFKWNFTRNYKKQYKISGSLSLWQPRYWDHVIRDQQDLHKHFDYIHWNPVKHYLVESPGEWIHSSFLCWYKRGEISEGWGDFGEPATIRGMEIE